MPDDRDPVPLRLADILMLASDVLGINPHVLAKATNLNSADSAIHAPAAAFGGVDFYPEFATKVAVLGYRLARNHPLPDSNKRTSFLAMVEYAERNGCRLGPLDPAEAEATMVSVASGEMSEEEFIGWVGDRLVTT